jgi:hypothetical protein
MGKIEKLKKNKNSYTYAFAWKAGSRCGHRRGGRPPHEGGPDLTWWRGELGPALMAIEPAEELRGVRRSSGGDQYMGCVNNNGGYCALVNC